MRLRSWLEQNADSGGSMNAKSHITTFKWRHINAFPVHLSSNNSLEQCAVHAHEIVFFSREAWTVLPWRAVWIGVLNQRFKTLILPSQNKHERSLTQQKLEGLFVNDLPTKTVFLIKRWHVTKFTENTLFSCNFWTLNKFFNDHELACNYYNLIHVNMT